MVVLIVNIQIHEARATKSLRLLFQVDNENVELRWASESLLLADSAPLHRAAKLERGCSDKRRQKPSLQEMSFRHFFAQGWCVSPHDDKYWRHDRSNDAQIRRETDERSR